MEYDLVIHRRASDQLGKLHWEIDERIREKIKGMANDPWRDITDYDIETVEGTDHDIYRTRIGDYRAFFLLEKPYVAILHVDDREGAYGDTDTLDDRAGEF